MHSFISICLLFAAVELCTGTCRNLTQFPRDSPLLLLVKNGTDDGKQFYKYVTDPPTAQMHVFTKLPYPNILKSMNGLLFWMDIYWDGTVSFSVTDTRGETKTVSAVSRGGFDVYHVITDFDVMKPEDDITSSKYDWILFVASYNKLIQHDEIWKYGIEDTEPYIDYISHISNPCNSSLFQGELHITTNCDSEIATICYNDTLKFFDSNLAPLNDQTKLPQISMSPNSSISYEEYASNDTSYQIYNGQPSTTKLNGSNPEEMLFYFGMGGYGPDNRPYEGAQGSDGRIIMAYNGLYRRSQKGQTQFFLVNQEPGPVPLDLITITYDAQPFRNCSAVTMMDKKVFAICNYTVFGTPTIVNFQYLV